MEENKSIENLENFARERGIPYYSSRKSHSSRLNLDERYSSIKYIIFNLENYSPGTFFIFYDSFSTKVGSTINYSGLFREFPECLSDLKIFRRDWFDIFSFSKRYKTGNKYIDKNVTIFSDFHKLNNTLIKSENIRKFVELSSLVKPIYLEVELNAYNMVNKLNKKNLISIRSNRWILDSNELSTFILKGTILMNSISPMGNNI